MDPVTLVISFHMKAEEMGTYKKKEFCQGLAELGCNSVADLKAQIPRLREEFRDKSSFKEIYKYVFEFLKEEGMRNIKGELGVAMWNLLLKEHFGPSFEPV